MLPYVVQHEPNFIALTYLFVSLPWGVIALYCPFRYLSLSIAFFGLLRVCALFRLTDAYKQARASVLNWPLPLILYWARVVLFIDHVRALISS